MSSHSTSKKPSSKSKKSTTSSAPVSSSSTSKKRSTPLPPPSEDSTNKRAKRSVVGNGKKSLREEELGVGQEIEEDETSQVKAGKGKDRDQDEEEEEEDEDEEGGDGGVTRCVCGDDNEEMSSGLMIQCDTCKCWQHGPCVGLWEEKECPNRYFCELCKPALHGPGGLLRKVSRKSSAPAARRVTRSPSVTTSHKGASTSTSHPEPNRTHSKPRESLDSHHSHSHHDARSPSHEEAPSKESSKRKKAGPPGPPPKKRSTMNSRDAAYDDAIALSILEAGGAARRDKLEGRERSDSDSDEEGEERSEVEEKSEDEKEEEEVGTKQKGRKVTSAPKGKSGAAKSGAKKTAPTGGKGKSSGRSSNARSKSELSEQTSLVVPKTEPEHDQDEEQQELEGEEGEVEETGGRKKKRNISPELGGEKESIVVDGEGKEDEAGAMDEDKLMKDVEGEAIVEDVQQVEEEEEIHEASPAPLPIPTIVAPPTTHHTTSRAKHPNQYTYRPKNGTAAVPSTSTSISTSSRNPRASPLKGRSHAKDDSTLSVPSATNSKSSKSANSGGMSKSEKAEREREKKQWASELGIHLGWSLPEHLKHLGYLLPSQTPEPITVPTSASVYAATMQNGGGGSIVGGQYNPLQDYEELSSTFRPTSTDQSDGSGHHFEPPHKVKFPAKRTTMPEMKKRIKSLGEYLDKVRQELGDREKKDEVLRRAIEANRMMKSGQVPGAGEEEMGVGGSQALGTSAISEGTLKAMESLGRELVMFQQRFDS